MYIISLFQDSLMQDLCIWLRSRNIFSLKVTIIILLVKVLIGSAFYNVGLNNDFTYKHIGNIFFRNFCFRLFELLSANRLLKNLLEGNSCSMSSQNQNLGVAF